MGTATALLLPLLLVVCVAASHKTFKDNDLVFETDDGREPISNRIVSTKKFKRQQIDEDDPNYYYEGLDDDEFSGSGDSKNEPITMRVTFVMQEPYHIDFSNQNSPKFVNLSTTITTAVNDIYDTVEGDQRAYLVRIQSLPKDDYACNVTLDITSANNDNHKEIMNVLNKHIINYGRLGEIVVSADDFTYKIHDGDPDVEIDPETVSNWPVTNLDPVTDSEPENKARCDDQRKCNDDPFPVYICDDQFCDGKIDCANGEDERNCAVDKEDCLENEFSCDVSKCISKSAVCNNVADCSDGTDERNCTVTCQEHQFKCNNGICIDLSLKCNQRNDCSQGEDERDCCQLDEFMCRNRRCINYQERCNNNDDCGDYSDEEECPNSCGPGYQRCDDGKCVPYDEPCLNPDRCPFRCGNGTCIDNSKVCDSIRDCDDGVDERDCTCDNDEFRCYTGTCISINERCNNVTDCEDESDELNCPPQACPSDQYHCDSGECILFSDVCNNNPDCEDGSDEYNCDCQTDEWRCTSSECIPESIYCDGTPDCRDGSDEPPNCQVSVNPPDCDQLFCDGRCLDESKRCDNRQDCSSGEDEENCSSCDEGQLMCSTHRTCYPASKFCDGVDDCEDGSDELSCTGFCRPNEWSCVDSGECIPNSLICNNIRDCRDGSDEPPSCQPQIPVTQSPGLPSLNLKTYPNQQVIKESPFYKGGEVVFQCRDESYVRSPVEWSREGGRLPVNSTDVRGRLVMPNVQMSDSGSYICRAVGIGANYPGNQLKVYLTVEPYKHEEYRPVNVCKYNEATCSNGDCIAKEKVCDGNLDCRDRSDESGCKTLAKCEPNEFECSNRRCILMSWVCDGEDDCKDGSDEESCSDPGSNSHCKSSEHLCNDGIQCIPKGMHCDYQADCIDRSDEWNCTDIYISKPPPPMVKLPQGEIMIIRCVAIGVPIPFVIWRLNWRHIPEKCTSTSINGVGTLTCPDIQKEDEGAYSCEALNSRGSSFATPDTILLVNTTMANVCPSGFFNVEARRPQECIACFCFGATTKCRSADLFTYQLPLSFHPTQLTGVMQRDNSIIITDEPVTDMFDLREQNNGAIISRIGSWSPRNISPYLVLPEQFLGNQLTSYGGHIKYILKPFNVHTVPYNYAPLPDIILKGTDIVLVHRLPQRIVHGQNNEISVRIFEGKWQKVTPSGMSTATRGEIMMVLANVESLLLRAESGGNGVIIIDFKMDSAKADNTGQGLAAFVEECSCPRGYSGLSCQKCSPGFIRISSGRWLGQCKQAEPPCESGFYGNPNAGIPCKQCPCPHTNPDNQFSSTCHLASDGQITCNCPPGYTGRRCQECDVDYIGNPMVIGGSCRYSPPPVSECDPRGTQSERNGFCKCKNHAVGPKCSECAPKSFHLSSDNIFGCSRCFCSGVSETCTSSTWRKNLVEGKFASRSSAENYRLTSWADSSDDSNAQLFEDLLVDTKRRELTYTGFDRTKPNVYYWSLPDRFNGDKVTAYGGFLKYTIRHQTYPDGQTRNSAPDLQIVSRKDITLVYYSDATPDANGYLTNSVQILEQNWEKTDRQQVSRESLLMALADVKDILIKATYTDGTHQVSLANVTLEVAEKNGVGERGYHVENCQCPLGYLGTSCEYCAPGYTRGQGGLYLGECVECSCNGHSNDCHPETGECRNCQHNTQGSFCDQCKDSYKGDAELMTPDACQPNFGVNSCYCNPDGTLEDRCGEREQSCICKSNVFGNECSHCLTGTFKLSANNPQGCMSCYCSDVTDVCTEAGHYWVHQIPVVIFDESHGFTLVDLDRSNNVREFADSNFRLEVYRNQIGYHFGNSPPRGRIYWSLPRALTGNRITSYGGNIEITQKYESLDVNDEPYDDVDVMLIGQDKILTWVNPVTITADRQVNYTVPLVETEWNLYEIDDAPRPVSRHDMLSVLANIKEILIRATLSRTVSITYLADITMDSAIPIEGGSRQAENIEECRCPVGYTGTSCESCSAGYYLNKYNKCVKCPCNGREESCHLGHYDEVVCVCTQQYIGTNCGSEANTATEIPPINEPVPAPTIQVTISQPALQIKEIGGTVQFVCRASSHYSNRPIRISWSKEGGVLPFGRSIEDVSRGLLIINDLTESDSGSYICRASDGISIGTNRATLTVPTNAVPPEVTLSHETIRVYEGEPIEVECKATGYPKPNLSWHRGNRQPLNRQHLFDRGVYMISSARMSDAGIYRCVAANDAGESQKSVTIIVNRQNRPEPSVLTTNVTDPLLREGEDFTINCYSEPAIRQDLIYWTRENGPLPSNIQSNYGQLRINNARPEDSGNYVCSSYQDYIEPITIQIIVNREPVNTIPGDVIVEFENTTIFEGETLTISCNPNGNPLPVVKWVKLNAEFEPGTSQRGNKLYISNANYADRGRYICLGIVGDNTVAQKSTAVSVERRESPVIDIYPNNNMKVIKGANVQIQCRATGIPEPDITWNRLSNRNLSPNTRLLQNGILSINNIDLNEEGVYVCSASNLAGYTSANISIKVHSYPEVETDPDGTIETTQGSRVILKCRGSGLPTPMVYWKKSSPTEQQVTKEEFGMSVFELDRVDNIHSGVYECIVSNEEATVVKSVTLDIIDGDDNSSSDEVIANEGEDVDISCIVYNSQSRITWSRKDFRPLPSNSRQIDNKLTLRNVTKSDSGYYECLVHNDQNVVVSRTELFVEILRPPRITLQPPKQVVSPGDLAYLRCVATGDEPLDVYWRPSVGDFPPHVTENQGTLTFEGIKVEDAGKYVCTAMNEIGKADAIAEVIVTGPLMNSVIIRPETLSIKEGESVVVECKTTGENFNLRWSKESSRERPSTQPIAGGLLLLISNATSDHTGTYRCDGRDRNGSPHFKDFTLYVETDSKRSATLLDVQNDEIYVAPIGSMVEMPCSTDIPPPVTYEWERPHIELSKSIKHRSPVLRLTSLTENDAGYYTCKTSNGWTKSEKKVILKVSHVVPKFEGDGYVELKTLVDVYMKFDIEISIKPQGANGIILYNSQRPGRDSGDFVALSLNNGVPQFHFSYGDETTVIRANETISMDEWHTINVIRIRKDVYMKVDNKASFKGISTGVQQGLDLSEPLYIGGVPDTNQLPDRFQPRTGFVGCIGKLMSENTEIMIMRDARDKVRVDECDSCSEGVCYNNAVCLEALTERGYMCLCPEGYSGLDCNQRGEACRPGLCGTGRCTDTANGFNCTCPIGFIGERCETRLSIEYPAFGGGAYIAYAPPKATRHMKMSLKIKPNYPIKDGLILYSAESRGGHGHFTSLAVKDGYLEYRCDVGSGAAVIRSQKPLVANQWVHVNISRLMNIGKLYVEGQELRTITVNGSRALYLTTPLYVGGYDSKWLTINKGTGVESGFNGCIADVEVLGQKLDIMNGPIKSANIKECSEESNDNNPSRRGDMYPEENESFTEVDVLCPHCINGGWCRPEDPDRCLCPDGFQGSNCQFRITPTNGYKPCDAQPCQRNSTCRPLSDNLYKCDCPLNTGGYNCKDYLELGEDVSLNGEGYVELPASLFPHRDYRIPEMIAVAITTESTDGLLVFQGEKGRMSSGDFVMLNINGGYAEFQWELGTGVNTIANKRVFIADNKRHKIIAKRIGFDVSLEVDDIEERASGSGMSVILNADSNIYIGGLPVNMTSFGIIGFNGCLHQIELQETTDHPAINLGRNAIASRNAGHCPKLGGE